MRRGRLITSGLAVGAVMAITAATALAGSHGPLFTKDATDQGYGGVTAATPTTAAPGASAPGAPAPGASAPGASAPGASAPGASAPGAAVGGVAGVAHTQQQPLAATGRVGALPFTGAQLGVFVALGLVLLAGGLLLRRTGRGRPHG